LTKKINIVLFFLFLVSMFNARAVVLEELLAQGALKNLLQDKVVGYYVGSFDPLHLAHKNIAERVADYFCDFIIIYPMWGNDGYKKRRWSLHERLDMIFAVMAHHPKIIVTKLDPFLLQEIFTTVDAEQQYIGTASPAMPISQVKPASFIKAFIGILGSDQALALGLVITTDSRKEAARKNWLDIFMQGYKYVVCPENYNRACVSALPVESFIVVMRNSDDVSALDEMVGERCFVTMEIEPLLRKVSSTEFRNLLEDRKGEAIEKVPSEVWKRISGELSEESAG